MVFLSSANFAGDSGFKVYEEDGARKRAVAGGEQYFVDGDVLYHKVGWVDPVSVPDDVGCQASRG